MRARLAWAMVSVSLLGVALASASAPTPLSHTDNGRRIFLQGTTSAGRVGGNSHGMAGRGGAMCPGPAGGGGLMPAIRSPDFTYPPLTVPRGHEPDLMTRRHPPFNRETIKAAIVAGIDPAGTPPHEEMPRWRGLSPADLEDLIDYLQVLSQGKRRTLPGPERM